MTTAEGKRITIILPSFRDERIVDAISSIRAFDDLNTVRIVIIDGASGESYLQKIRPLLRDGDVLTSEPDRGIFDALNKGLDLVQTPYLGWLGSDDVYSSAAKSSNVLTALANHDLYVMDLVHVRDGRIRRRTHSWPCSVGLAQWGLHNPHYTTFGRSELLRKYRFRLDIHGSDIDYFIRVFQDSPHVLRDPSIGMLMAEGGYSTAGYGRVAKANLQLFEAYRRARGPIGACCALMVKLSYKALGLIRYKLWPRYTTSLLQPELKFSTAHPARGLR